MKKENLPGRIRRLARAAALGMALALGLGAAGTLAVRAVDLEKACSLTVAAGSEELKEDLAKAGVVLDIYEVAEAVPVSGYDAYSYRTLLDFAALDLENAVTAAMDTESWRALAQEAGRIALQRTPEGRQIVTPSVQGAQPDSVVNKITKRMEDGSYQESDLEAGLYLVIARGADTEDYFRTIAGEDGEELLVTVAHSADYNYTFEPELISIPGKEPDEEGRVNTANPGEWLYDVGVTLKPEQDTRFGSLQILKTLESMEVSEPAIFVFSIEAVLDGEVVYSDVAAMIFTDPGQKMELIDKIPVGAEVTVTEVYTGASYALTTEEEQTAVIDAETVAQVSFTNTYDKDKKSGHGIINHFAYDGEVDEVTGEPVGWDWQQVTN